MTKQLTGEEEAAAAPAAVTAPAPVINITTNVLSNRNKLLVLVVELKVIERVVEKPAAPKKKTEKEN